ncbi:beta-propeller fold lactonase family protein [Spirillospora sp. NPDC029432]|uniref:lactonase family protein n=1 Tax=Spirillospora sp. NPDC029432 TaxID=3154599 RepID=UPI00345151ED
MCRLGRMAAGAAGLLLAGAASAAPASAAPVREAAPSGGRVVYVTNSANAGGTGNVARFAVTGAGTLTPVDALPTDETAGTRAMAFTPDARFGYVADTLLNRILRVRIGPDGALTRLGAVATQAPFAMAMSPDGRTLYASNLGSRAVSVFAVGRRGDLHPRDAVDTGAENSKGVAVTPDGRFLYVSHGTPADTARTVLTGFALRADGSVGRRVARAAIGVSGAETVITPDGRFVYVVNQVSDDVHGFHIAASGALRPVPGSPVPGGDFPEGAAISPDGHWLYVAAVGVGANPDAVPGQVLGFAIGDDGRLTETVPRTSMSSPIGIGFAPGGRRVYVSDFTDSIVNTFAVGPGGALRLLQTVPSQGPRPAFHSVNVPPAPHPSRALA